MAFSEYVYLLIAIAYFTISLSYLPIIGFSMVKTKTSDNDPGKNYAKIRYIMMFILYFIVAGLYLYEWKEKFGHEE